MSPQTRHARSRFSSLPPMAVQSRAQHARPRLTPLASAIAVLAIAGSLATSDAHAQARPFSSGWMAAKGAAQAQAAATGRLPNGMLAGINSAARQQQQSRQQLNRSVANLGSAAAAIAAQQAAQAAARGAAQNDPSVPDGLAEGGLKIDANPLTSGWLNAKAPVQSQQGGRTTVAIEQTKDKAILNWETFNVGKNTTVDFKQQADWAVLNRVNDPQARPSQIQGQIKGNGTVMIANANGVVFSGTSQVNVRNLVAAAAKISDAQFTSDGLYGKDNVATFTQAGGKIEVQAGAQIATHEASSVTRGGGYVLFVGSEVSNAGTITTRKGQAQLAAGDAFIIRKGVGTDANTASTTRGNEVAPQFNVDSTAGKVSNSGLILAREGDITLAGRDVRQAGVAVSTTTVNTRGTVHLLNSISDERGQITLSQNATTAVLIEDDGKTTALDSQRDASIKESGEKDLLRAQAPQGAFDNYSQLQDRRDQSRIEIVSGSNVVFEGDSLTLATGGQIVTRAARRSFVADQAQLDVSGAVGVQVAMESNNVKVNVQGFELRDAPLNRDSGKLSNNDVWIDRRQLVLVPKGSGGYESDRWYTSNGLLEVGGYLGTQGHSIGEWAAQGGMVILSGSEVITQVGSAVNLAGGTLDVATGYLNQTWLRGNDGRLYSLDKAPADMVFGGIYKGYEAHHARWDITETFYNPMIGPRKRLENGYTVGRDAGRIIVSAPTAVLEGDIVADVFNGSQQSRKRGATEDGYKQVQTAVARAAALALVGAWDRNAATWGIPYQTDVRFGAFDPLTRGIVADAALADDRVGTAWFDSAHINRQSLGDLDIQTRGAISIEEALRVADGGRLSLRGGKVDIAADLTARSGTIHVVGADGPANGVGTLVVRAGVTLDTRGVWTNNQLDSGSLTRLAYINGGNVTLTAGGDLTVEAGSLIDASAGGAILADGTLRGGAGGNVSLASYDAGNSNPPSGSLTLDGDVKAYGFNGGGSLTLRTGGLVVIDDRDFDLGTTMAPGQILPIDVVLTEDVAWPAGAPLPAAITINEEQIVPEGPLTSPLRLEVGQVGLVLTADIILPVGHRSIRYFVGDNPNDTNSNFVNTIPKGSKIYFTHTFASGVIIANGTLSLGVVATDYSAGSVAPTDVMFLAGQRLNQNSRVPVFIEFEALDYVHLASSKLTGGFSSYDINGEAGLIVGNDAMLAPRRPVLRFTDASRSVATGADPFGTLEHYLGPVYDEDPLKAMMAQRPSIDLAFRAGRYNASGNQLTGGLLRIGDGATDLTGNFLPVGTRDSGRGC